MTVGSAPHLFCFGLGYSAGRLAECLLKEGWIVCGTCRDEERRRQLEALGIRAVIFDRDRPIDDAEALIASSTDVLSSVPPDELGDPVLDRYHDLLDGMSGLRWVGYLSTTGVYGDTGGVCVDETAPLHPTTARSKRRARAEAAWLGLHQHSRIPVHVFRLAGIYGPGRSVVDQLLTGEAKRISRPGHLFSRIHVDDIAAVLRASMARPDGGRIYNVCDDEPAMPADVVAHACALLDVPPPPLVPFAEASAAMSPMALSFWQDNRRVDNARLKRELGMTLKYPTYREGLAAIVDALNRDRAGASA